MVKNVLLLNEEYEVVEPQNKLLQFVISLINDDATIDAF